MVHTVAGLRRPRTLGAAVLALILAGCTASHRSGSSTSAPPTNALPTSAPPTSASPTSAAPTRRGGSDAGWQPVALPAPGARILAMASFEGRTLVLGSVPGHDGRAPAAWITTDARAWQRIPLTPATTYGPVAELTYVGVAGPRLDVYGLAFGGAHGNPRPSLWTGTAAGLVEHEQPFETFGGPHLISVNGETARPGTALIVGQWDGASGRYGAAVWTSSDGANWSRNADDPALASAPGEQTAARGAAASGGGFVVVGDTMRGDSTSALAWTSADGRAWKRIRLPSAGPATAARAGCDAAGCVVVGNSAAANPSLLCWTLRPDGTPTGAARTGPRGGLIQPDQVLVRAHDALAVVAIDSTERLVSVHRDCSGATSIPLPATSRRAAVGEVGGRLLLATTGADASQLWMR